MSYWNLELNSFSFEGKPYEMIYISEPPQPYSVPNSCTLFLKYTSLSAFLVPQSNLILPSSASFTSTIRKTQTTWWYEMKNLDRKIWVRFPAEAVKLESACSLKSSDTKSHQGGSCAPTLMDLHVTFAVHPIASNGWGGHHHHHHNHHHIYM